MADFTDKVIIVTGAAGNLGAAVARAFRAAGGKLVLVGHRRSKLEEAFADWLGAADVLLVEADLTVADQVNGMAGKVVEYFGHIDVLANVAGGFTMGAAVHETDLAIWEQMLDLNAKSVLLCAKAVVPTMLKQGGGKIVNVAARAGLEGKAKMGAYTVSKSAVIRLTESMAAELKNENINVNCILPGTIDTPQNRAAMPKANFDKWVAPEQLAQVILFLASEAATAVHGAAIPVTGLS